MEYSIAAVGLSGAAVILSDMNSSCVPVIDMMEYCSLLIDYITTWRAGTGDTKDFLTLSHRYHRYPILLYVFTIHDLITTRGGQNMKF